MFCDYDVLKNLYSLQIRNQQRKSESQYLLLLTMDTKAGKTPPKPLLYKDMSQLTEVLKRCLRKNDVVASYSESQYLLMLSSLSHENAEMVRDRLESEFARCCTLTAITYSIVAIH